MILLPSIISLMTGLVMEGAPLQDVLVDELIGRNSAALEGFPAVQYRITTEQRRRPSDPFQRSAVAVVVVDGKSAKIDQTWLPGAGNRLESERRNKVIVRDTDVLYWPVGMANAFQYARGPAGPVETGLYHEQELLNRHVVKRAYGNGRESLKEYRDLLGEFGKWSAAGAGSGVFELTLTDPTDNLRTVYTIDPATGYALTRIRTFIGGDISVDQQIHLQELDSSLFLPRLLVTTRYEGGNVVNETRETVDDIVLRPALAPDAFEPAGLGLAEGVRLLAHRSDGTREVFQSVDGALMPDGVARTFRPESDLSSGFLAQARANYAVLVAGAGAVLIIVGLIVLLRRRKRIGSR